MWLDIFQCHLCNLSLDYRSFFPCLSSYTAICCFWDNFFCLFGLFFFSTITYFCVISLIVWRATLRWAIRFVVLWAIYFIFVLWFFFFFWLSQLIVFCQHEWHSYWRGRNTTICFHAGLSRELPVDIYDRRETSIQKAFDIQEVGCVFLLSKWLYRAYYALRCGKQVPGQTKFTRT